MKNLILYLFAVLLLASCKTQNIMEESASQRKSGAAAIDSAFRYNPKYQYSTCCLKHRRPDSIFWN